MNWECYSCVLLPLSSSCRKLNIEFYTFPLPHQRFLRQRAPRSDSSLKSTSSSIPGLGGKIIITGIGKVDDDEFTLNLFNEQVSSVIWQLEWKVKFLTAYSLQSLDDVVNSHVGN